MLVTADDLAAALADDEPPVLLDVRWALGRSGPVAHERYLAGHLPGAAYVDLEAELAVPLPGFIKRRAESKIMTTALEELRHRCEDASVR